MSGVSNLINLSADESLISTDILQTSPSPALINPSININIPSTPIITYPVLGPGKFITPADARYSLDNNPFDRILKEANLHDDPFEMVFNEVDIKNTSNNCNHTNSNNKVITENLLQLDNDTAANNNDFNSLQIPRFSRLASSGQLSSVSSIGSTNSNFGDNISSIRDDCSLNTGFVTENTIAISGCSGNTENSETEFNKDQLNSVSNIILTNSNFCENISSIRDDCSLNTGFITENTIAISGCSDNIENSDNELNKGFLVLKNILNSTEVDPIINSKNKNENSQMEIGTLLQLNNDYKMDILKIPKFNRLCSSNGQLSSVSSIVSYDSPNTVSYYNNSDSISSQNYDSYSIVNKKIVAESNTMVSNDSQFNKGFIESSQNNLNLTENNISNSKEHLLKNIYTTLPLPDGQSTPNKESSSSNSSLCGGAGIQLKSHKYDLRNRLLKLSISNSSINSPLQSYRKSSINKTSEDGGGSSLELSVFNEASNIAELYSQLITSSPSSNISEDSCDDLMSIKPNWLDSKSDIDSDLELLKIPILAEMDNVKNKSNNNSIDDHQENNNIVITKSSIPNIEKNINNISQTDTISSNLDKLKEKIKQHKIKNNAQDINALINGLKGLVFECTQDEKKDEASNLLESLSTLLSNDGNNSGNKYKNKITNKSKIEKISIENNSTDENVTQPFIPPQPIIRQRTFDLDPKDDEDVPDIDEGSIIAGNHYDNEQSINDNISQQEIQPELANIVEQIGKLIGGTQNVNIVTTNLNQNSIDGNGQLLNTNPTYIVVMGTPSKRKISYYDNNSSPKNQTETRRRSQSFSLHDKKLKLPTTNSNNKLTNYSTTSPKKEFQTPIRSTNYTGRRNSISTTTVTPVRRSMYGQTTVPKTSIKPITPQLQRRSMLIETTTATTKSYSTKPIVNFRNDFNTKQIKFKTANEPAQRSKGPLKATIPVKRVAPLIVSSSVSLPNDDSQKHIYHNKPITSTPVALPSKSSNNKNLPKACSTPVVVVSSSTNDLLSPTRNSHKNRMRYSYASTTPNTKSYLSAQSSMVQRNHRRSFTESRSPIKRQLQNDIGKTLKNFKFDSRAAALKLNLPTTLNKENKQPRPGF